MLGSKRASCTLVMMPIDCGLLGPPMLLYSLPTFLQTRIGRVRVGREKEGKEKRKGRLTYPFIVLKRISLSRLALVERFLSVSKYNPSVKLFLWSGSAGAAGCASGEGSTCSSAILLAKKWLNLKIEKKRRGKKPTFQGTKNSLFLNPPIVFPRLFAFATNARVTEKKGRVPAWGKQEAEEARPQARIM